MAGIIGKKVGMTSIFGEDGKYIPCTIIQAGPCVVSQIKNVEKDGYDAVQLAFEEKRENKTNKAMAGHYKKAGVSPRKKAVEFRNFQEAPAVGDTIGADIFVEGEYIDVVGTSIGKGFQGVVKRHNFSGVGGATHGQHDRLRAPGSIGASSFPSRVFKGIRMGGRMGGERVKVANLQVVKIMAEENIMLLKGAVPGAKNSYILLEK